MFKNIVTLFFAHLNSIYQKLTQATENAVAFYESQGFTRVGAAARYQDLDPEVMERKRVAERAEMFASVSKEIITILDHLEGAQEETEGEASEAAESDFSCFSELPPKVYLDSNIISFHQLFKLSFFFFFSFFPL